MSRPPASFMPLELIVSAPQHHTEPTRAAREEPDSKDWLRACLLIVLTIVEWRPTD